MERVDVYRGAAEMDADGNPVQGEMRHVATLMGFVAPVEASQSPGADCLVVRGKPLMVDGPPLEWWRCGRHIGDVVNAFVREG